MHKYYMLCNEKLRLELLKNDNMSQANVHLS